MLNILVPPHAVYSPWFDARTQPPVRSGPYEVRGTQSAAYAHHIPHVFFRLFDSATGRWRHSWYGPLCSVGRIGTTYEWRGLLAGHFYTHDAVPRPNFCMPHPSDALLAAQRALHYGEAAATVPESATFTATAWASLGARK